MFILLDYVVANVYVCVLCMCLCGGRMTIAEVTYFPSLCDLRDETQVGRLGASSFTY